MCITLVPSHLTAKILIASYYTLSGNVRMKLHNYVRLMQQRLLEFSLIPRPENEASWSY